MSINVRQTDHTICHLHPFASMRHTLFTAVFQLMFPAHPRVSLALCFPAMFQDSGSEVRS
jgi:hypothetical protein